MKKIFGRVIVVVPAIAVQVAWYILLFGILNRILNQHLADIINVIFTILAVVFVLYLITKRDESSYKILWVIVIVAMPILGALLYLFLGDKSTGKELKGKLEKSKESLQINELKGNKNCIEDIRKENLRIGQTLSHLSDSTGFPLYNNSTAKYYSFGEEMFKDMLVDLKTAEEFIYIEYFIIQSGKFWDSITDILEEKAAAGVDVRVMYDDLGSIATYSPKDIKALLNKGIRCIAFNPFFFIKTQLNNRDHRKMMIIDNKIAYSGGVNLADEYINETHPFGRWKDIGFRITGDAVNSYTYMFAEFWNAFAITKIEPERVKFSVSDSETENGYILPYYDSPVRDEHTSNILFAEMLSMATDYVWFYTPYLMLGDALFDAFIRAAERGVDVRIITPGIPDKKIVYALTRSYYKDLLEAGVKIYEYTPGFVHAKAFIADDIVCGIGTVNLDYRSLFLHFECNSVFYNADIIKELKADFLETQDECHERTLAEEKTGILHRLINSVLRVAAPLL
ncbi:MAG: cardiolipin synthase [Eubacterium sp.]|nr:cardiolipin synthase [Eubacterium sp.]